MNFSNFITKAASVKIFRMRNMEDFIFKNSKSHKTNAEIVADTSDDLTNKLKSLER